MIKSKNKNKNKCLKLCVAFLFPFSLFGGLALTNISSDASNVDYIYYHEEGVSLSNSSFTEGSTPYATGNSLSSWNAIESDSKASGMLIDVGSGSNTNNEDNPTFSRYQSTYMLNSNPGAKGSDTRILMINSKQTSSQSNVPARKGYRSSSINLESNSYYRFTVSVKTSPNGDDSVNASLYLSGLEDLDGQTIQMGYENITTPIWKEYYIFVATGSKAQTVTLDLYLGSANGQSSYGAVFFDEVHVDRYSQNAFFETCYDYGYNDEDNYTSLDPKNTKFLVKDLVEKQSLANVDDYNFDFENEIAPDSNTLGEEWSIVDKNNGHAVISNIRNMQPTDFKTLTGYDYIGDDLSYQNSQALILYTRNNNNYSSGYVGVQSKDIMINAHEIYKISLKLKVATTNLNGSFYLKVQENNTIYSLYPTLLSDKEGENHYVLQNGQTSGITSNTSNKFTNDYQTVELYVKGHSLYNSSFNLELWLGDQTTSAQGCVVIDDIKLEYSNYEAFNSASNKVEFKSFASSPSTISNGYFNATECESLDDSYPMKASNWTRTFENNKKNKSGVIYLNDRETYEDMYTKAIDENGNKKYDWAGIFPAGLSTNPNNVYMMYNKSNSYQSIQSNDYTLSSNSYYKLSFDYFNQNFQSSSSNPSKIKLEIIDEDGIVIFSKGGISSLDRWDNMSVYLHTAETVSHNVHVVISLGEKDDLVSGYVYLDNVIFETSNEESFNGAIDKANLDDYYINLIETSSSITSSPAYDLSVDAIYNSSYSDADKDLCAVGGVVNGKNNPFVNINEDLALENGNYLVLSTRVASKASLKSKYKLSLNADSYYKLTFDLATIFNDEALNSKTDKHDCAYGVEITVEGYESISKLVTLNELKSYTIYLKSSEASTPVINFSLISDCDETLGSALLTNLNLTSVDESEYDRALIMPNYQKSVFSAKQTAQENEDDNDNDNDNNNNNSTQTNGDSKWLLIPSIITAVALVVGIVGWALRKVKIKKIEKIKAENYDRKLSINHDAILKEAQERRDKEVDDLNKAKGLLENQKKEIEENHKQYIKDNNVNSNFTKENEKVFKKYNQDISRINEKISILSEQISNVSSADYLLNIERKIIAEREEEFSKEKRERKAQVKEQKKLNKDK